MNFNELGIQNIEPLAVLRGGIDGAKFIAKVVKKDGRSQLLYLIPPSYDPSKGIVTEEYILESAIEKHGFLPIEQEPILTYEDYENYLREINKPYV